LYACWPLAFRDGEKALSGKRKKRKKDAKTIKNAPNGIRTKDPSTRNCTPFQTPSSFSRPPFSVTLFALSVETRLFLTLGCFEGSIKALAAPDTNWPGWVHPEPNNGDSKIFIKYFFAQLKCGHTELGVV